MIRVCCYCEKWSSGGIESFLNNVLTRVDPTRVQLDIVVSELHESIFTQSLREKGISFYELSGRTLNLPKNRRLFRNLLAGNRYDVVYLNLFQGLSLSYAALARQAGVPVRIAHSHNTALRKSPAKPLKLMLHNLGKVLFADCITHRWACSAAAAEFLFGAQQAQKNRFRFVPNGIQTDRFRFDPQVREQVRRELNLENQFVIGSVGRLCDQKNQSFLLDVFAQVVKKRPDSRLLLVGEGADEPILRQKAGELGIEGKVLFYGVSSCVEQLLWGMDVLAFPSLFEGLGIAAVEAQASGLEVLCSEHVPDEAFVTPLARRQPLTTGPLVWAERLLEITPDRDRAAAADAVRQAGFDIEDVAAEITRGFGVT